MVLGVFRAFEKRTAKSHVNEMSKAASKYMEFLNGRSSEPTPEEIKKESALLKDYNDKLQKMQEDYKKISKDFDPKDHKTISYLRALQMNIIKYKSILEHGKFDDQHYKAAVFKEAQKLNDLPPSKSKGYQLQALARDNLQRELFDGKTIAERSTELNKERDRIYEMHAEVEKLDDKAPNKVQKQSELADAIKQYGQKKAQLFLDQMELGGKTAKQREEYIERKNQSLNKNPAYDFDPVAKLLLKAECDNLPKVNKENFIKKVSDLIRYQDVSPELADQHYNSKGQLAEFVKERLGPGYTVDEIPGGSNNKLLKVSDGSNTVVVKMGMFAGKMTEMGCDYPTALEKMEDKSKFAEVYHTEGSVTGGNTYQFEVGEFLTGENMASYYRKQDVSTEDGLLRRQHNALRDISSIIDLVQDLQKQGMVYSDLKCGNFIRDNNGEFKIADMKSLIYKGTHADSEFRTRDIPVTYMSPSCIQGTGNKQYFDLDKLVRTALAAQLIEMLTLSQDPGTSPGCGFDGVKINWDQAILKNEFGLEIKKVYDKLVGDPNYSLNEAKRDVQLLQERVDAKLNQQVSQETKGVVNNTELSHLTVKTTELTQHLLVTGVNEDNKHDVVTLCEQMPKLEPVSDHSLQRIFDEIEELGKELMQAIERYDERKENGVEETEPSNFDMEREELKEIEGRMPSHEKENTQETPPEEPRFGE